MRYVPPEPPDAEEAADPADPSALLAGGDVGGAVLAVLKERPLTGWEIARALDASAPGCLEGREGYLYPLLAGLHRKGAVEARWVDLPGGRPRREYFPSGAPVPADAPLPLLPPSLPPDPALDSVAHDATRTVHGAFDRESARAEVLAHLETAATAYARLGMDPAEAARRAAADLGDPWKIRTDLARVHRGRPVVVFPHTLTERIRSWAIYDLVPLTILVALVVLLRWQVVQAYNIPTDSMEPTLHGDDVDPDLILVDKTVFLRRDPQRWDIIVFDPPPEADARDEDEEAPSAFVKRACALGGETLDIAAGDLIVDGVLARRTLEVEDAMMVVVSDLDDGGRSGGRRPRKESRSASALDRTWKAKAGAWTDPDGVLVGSPGPEGEARLAYVPDVTNSYADAEGMVRNHYDPVGDAEVRFVVTVLDEGTEVGAELTEGADRHSLRIGPAGLVLRSGERTWTRREVRAGPGRPMEVRFRNVDDRLTVRVDGELLLREELPSRTVVPRKAASAGVELAAAGGAARFAGVRVLRDVHYLRGGGGSWPRKIPEGHVFFMGDNSGSSRDSRHWGTVPVEDLIGVPFAIVFPPQRARTLR